MPRALTHWITVALLAAPTLASATTLSVNFVDSFLVDAMSSTDIAGESGVRAMNWNNVQAAASGGGSGFVYDDGSASTASLTFTTDLANWRLPHAVFTSDDTMWKGYLDAQGLATVTFAGLEFIGTYDVYVYFDGDSGSYWKTATYSIGGTSQSGEDSESTDWGAGQNAAKLYQLPVPGAACSNQPFGTCAGANNNEGNYVLLSGVSGTGFTLTAASNAAQDSLLRAPINGIQIVGTAPEPSTAMLLAFGLLMLVVRRRGRA